MSTEHSAIEHLCDKLNATKVDIELSKTEYEKIEEEQSNRRAKMAGMRKIQAELERAIDKLAESQK